MEGGAVDEDFYTQCYSHVALDHSRRQGLCLPCRVAITADGDCSYEIKRYFLLGRKTMTILDSILKSRDPTLVTKVCVVRAMVFPVVMHVCESWNIKKVEC